LDDPLTQAFPSCIFPEHLTLIPGLREVYELHLAWLEAQTLSCAALEVQAAYFASVDGIPPRHFLTWVGETLKLPDVSSASADSTSADRSGALRIVGRWGRTSV
jgi:hypothetical protein